MNLRAKAHFESVIATGDYNDRLMQSAEEILAQDDVKQMLTYLAAIHGLSVKQVLMSNPKAPDYLVVLHGCLPMDDLKQKFAATCGLKFTEFEAVWPYQYVALIGDGGDIDEQ